MKKRIGTLFICFLMCFTILPVAAFADETPVETPLEDLEVVLSSETTEDADELIREYITVSLQEEGIVNLDAAQRKKAYDSLTTLEKTVYDLLKEQIELVAAGERTDTRFAFTMKDLGLDEDLLTAEDLGVDRILIMDEDGNKEISDDAVDAAIRKYYLINYTDLVYALISDCPYSLYWFNKNGNGELNGFQCDGFRFEAGTLKDGTEVLWPSAIGTFNFLVANEFQADGEPFEVGSIGEDVSRAKETVANILQKYKNEDDYHKLLGYKDEICKRAVYNDEAMEDESFPYGNPWQMIWIFDHDADVDPGSHQIVCEGYSKAFQYLFDLSEFDNPIDCYTVTGPMDGGTGEGGAHAWNVVTMEDGKNYLVDLTNCDEGTVGADDKLFLVGYTSRDEQGKTHFIDINGRVVSYTYEDEMFRIYNPDNLALADSNYEPSSVEPVIAIKNLALPKTAEVAANGTYQLQPAFTPTDTTETGITWESDNTKIAKVDKNGKVTGIKRGTATITATSTANSKLTAKCKVTVLFSDATHENVSDEMFDAIYRAADKKITGMDTKFGTLNSMTRAQFVRFLYRYANMEGKYKIPAKYKKQSPFKDVPTNYTHYNAIIWAVEKGLIAGYSGGVFKPQGTLTRNHVATILWKFAGSPKVKNPKRPFSDVAKSNAIAWGKEQKIFTGSKFLPKTKCLRGDFALFLYRYNKSTGK